jgi:probable HAF family extracellular repeat protein
MAAFRIRPVDDVAEIEVRMTFGRISGRTARMHAGVVVVAMTIVLGLVAPAHAAKYYEARELPNRGEGEANGINSAGDVVMTTDTGGNNVYAEIFSRGMTTTISYQLPCPEPGQELNYCTDSEATGVNGNRQIAGNADAISCCVDAYMYRYDFNTGMVHKIPSLGGAASSARAINGAGQVVGWSETPGGARHAFLWNGYSTKDLGTLGGSTSAAYGTYARGQAVGCSRLANGHTHPFLYQDGVMEDLGLPAGRSNGCATSINVDGVIVGNAGRRAWIKTSSGFTLLPLPADAIGMRAAHIANNGEVVGQYRTADAAYGYIYTGGTVVTLNTAIPFDDFDITDAASNNLKGQIAATAGAYGGGWSSDAYLPGTPLRLTQINVLDEDNARLSYVGGWSRVASTLAFGGYLTQSCCAQDSVEVTFTGRDVSVIGTLRPSGGQAIVYLDGVNVGTADEFASVASPRQRVFSHEWSTVGTHTLRLVHISGSFNLDAITFAPR